MSGYRGMRLFHHDNGGCCMIRLKRGGTCQKPNRFRLDTGGLVVDFCGGHFLILRAEVYREDQLRQQRGKAKDGTQDS